MRRRRLAVAMCLAAILGAASWCDAAAKPKAAAGKKAAQAAPHYDVLYQVHVPTMADAIVAKLQEGIQKELAKHKSRDSDADYAIRKQVAENVQAALTRTVRELEDFALGWKLDRQQKRSFVDVKVTALPGSGLARQFAEVKELKTAFAGFVMPGAVLSARGVGRAAAADAAASAKVVELVRAKVVKHVDREPIADSEKAKHKELVNKCFDVVRDSVSSGRSDGALSVVAKPDRLTLIAGGYTADGAKLESVVKPIAQWLKEHHPAFGGLKVDAGEFEGVRFHTLSLPAPGGDEKFVKLFGESLEIVAGFGPQAAYLAAGKDAMKALKEAIQRSKAQAVPPTPFEVSLALKPLADFIAVMGKDHEKPIARKAASLLQGAQGKDHVRLVAEPIERGMILRLDAEEGLLQLIGALNPQAKKFLLGK